MKAKITAGTVALLCLVTLLSLTISSRYDFGSRKFYDRMSRNPTRRTLLNEKKTQSLLPTHHIAGYSPLLFDTEVTGLQTVDLSAYFRSLPFDRKTIIVKLPQSTITTIGLTLKLRTYSGVSVTLQDIQKRILLHCQEENCRTSLKAKSTPSPLLHVTLARPQGLSSTESFHLNAHQTTAKRPTYGDEIPTINLHLSPLQYIQLQTLTKKAQNDARNGRWQFPKNKLDAELQIGAQEQHSKVKINLSGRTGVHFRFPPSMGVRVQNGPLIMGSQNFKLYRIGTKGLLSDFVAISILRDSGVIVPQQRLVKLAINNKNYGIYIFEDNFSAAFFESIKAHEGFIHGTDTKTFFQSYPTAIRLKSDLLYNPSSEQASIYLNKMPPLDTKAFMSRVDEKKLAALIAFTTLMRATHGLGADDLRFYEEPLTQKLIPIARDLNMSTFPLSKNLSPYLVSSFAAWIQPRLPSLSPECTLRSFGSPQFERLYLYDVHPTVMHFLSTPQGRLLSEVAFLRLLQSDIPYIYRTRMKHVYDEIKNDIGPNTYVVNETEKQVTNTLTENPSIFMNKGVTGIISLSPPWLKALDATTLQLVNRLPFTLTVSVPQRLHASISTNCQRHPSKKHSYLLSPLWNNIVANPQPSPELLDSLYTQGIYKKDSAFVPSCQIRVAKKEDAKTFQKLTRWALADGTPISPVSPEHSATHLAETSNVPKALLQYHGVVDKGSQMGVRYLYHSNFPTPPNLDFSHLRFKNGETGDFLPYESIQITRFSHLDSLPNISPEVSRRVLRGYSLYYDSLSAFAKNSLAIDLVFNKQNNVTYFKLDPHSLRKSLSIAKVRPENIFLLDTREEHLMFRAEKPPSTAPRNPAMIAKRKTQVSNGITFHRIPAHSHIKLRDPVHITKNESLTIEAGATLQLGPNAKFLIEGTLKLLGTSSAPITFTPLETHWGGIALSNSQNDNLIRYTKMSGAVAYKDDSFQTFAGLSVLNSRLRIENSTFSDFASIDAINVFHGHLEFVESTVLRAKDDGIDSDFSTGFIDGSEFRHNGGDSIDLSQSNFSITNTTVKLSGDKGVSIGEKSVATVRNNTFDSNKWGVTIKDASSVLLSDNTFAHNEIGWVSLIKKPWYNKPEITVTGNLFNNNQHDTKNLAFFRY